MKDNGLTVTGGHFLLVDKLPDNLTHEFYTVKHVGYKVDGKFALLACHSDLFEPIKNNDVYTLYHLVLESDSDSQQFGIYAQGVLSESTSKNYFNSCFFENTG